MKRLSNFVKQSLWVGAGAVALLAVPAYASAATLSLSPSSGTVNAGSTLEVKILLDTTGATTSGTDAYIRFDPSVFQVVDANTAVEGVQILPGSLYSQTSYNVTDNASGKISFSGSKSGGSPGYSGSGTLATVTLQAVKDATGSEVTFDFTSGSTTDSNVIDQSSSDDVLTAVTNAKYTVSGSATTDDTTSDSTTDTTGPGGKDGTDGQGGSGEVADSGIDLNGYTIVTIISLVGAAFFLTRRPKTG